MKEDEIKIKMEEVERFIDSVKSDDKMLTAFMQTLVADDVVGSQLQNHYADFFGSSGLMN